MPFISHTGVLGGYAMQFLDDTPAPISLNLLGCDKEFSQQRCASQQSELPESWAKTALSIYDLYAGLTVLNEADDRSRGQAWLAGLCLVPGREQTGVAASGLLQGARCESARIPAQARSRNGRVVSWAAMVRAGMFRKHLIETLSDNPMTVSQIARLVDESPDRVADGGNDN